MEKNLKQIWSETINYGYKVNKNKQNGLESWQPLKSKFSKYILENNTNIPLKQNFISFVNSLNYKYNDTMDQNDVILTIGNSVLDNKIEKFHFIIQHFRIPMLEKFNLSIVKFAQLAYNIGQAKATLERGEYDDNIKKFYQQYKLDNINTFFDEHILDQNIKINHNGGFKNFNQEENYMNKYIKYKNKYLALKNGFNIK